MFGRSDRQFKFGFVAGGGAKLCFCGAGSAGGSGSGGMSVRR